MSNQNAIIGAGNGQPVSIDLDRLIGGHIAIIANSGGGKSGLIRKLAEVTAGSVQQIFLDPEDEFYTLRERHDYVIAGGEDGDIPVSVEGAKALALATLQHGFSLIVQLNDLGPQADAFVAAFLNAMIHAPRELWHPALVIIDEAQRFAPSGGTETPAARAVKALTAQGRKRGFTAVLASQRIAKIDANVRGDINNWMLGRVGQALDRNAMADQLGFSAREGRERLAGIADRHFWGFGPAVAAEPVLFRVADVETTPVRPGQAKVLTPPPAGALADILAGLVVEPTKADAPADAAPIGQAEHDEYNRLRERVRRVEADNLALEQDRDHWQKQAAELLALIERARAALQGPVLDAPKPVAAQIPTRRPVPAREARPAAQARPRTPSEIGGPSPAALAIADLLDRINPARVTWTQAASMTGRKASGGNFNAARKWLRESGRLIEEGDVIRSAQDPKSGMARAEAIDLWKSVLSNPAPRMIDAMLAWDEPDTKERLGADLGAAPRGGNFNNGLSQLRRNGLLYEYGSGSMKLADKLPGERDGGRG